jgi:hypothetical protein
MLFRPALGADLRMHTGTLIADLFTAVERAERSARRPRAEDPLSRNAARPASAERQAGVGSEGVDSGENVQSPNNSLRRLVCARLTGISVCFLSSMRSWYELLNQGTTSRMRLIFTR